MLDRRMAVKGGCSGVSLSMRACSCSPLPRCNVIGLHSCHHLKTRTLVVKLWVFVQVYGGLMHVLAGGSTPPLACEGAEAVPYPCFVNVRDASNLNDHRTTPKDQADHASTVLGLSLPIVEAAA